MKNITIKILATLAYVVMVTVNFLSNSLPINGRTPGEISDAYPNLFAPAGITFSIWGLIYLWLGAYVIYQFFGVSETKNQKPKQDKINLLFIGTSIVNISWIFAWHYDYTGLSLIVMFTLLCLLIKIADLNRETIKTRLDKFFIAIPFTLYFGWITVATIANATVFLVSIGYRGFWLSEVVITSLIIIVGALIGILRMQKDRNVIYGLVLIWAYLGILIKHISESGWDKEYPMIIATVILCLIAFAYFILKLILQKNKTCTVNNETLIFTIFGFTGDLSGRKIIPSLWNLYMQNKLPKNFKVVGFARSELSSDALINTVKNSIEKCLCEEIDQNKLEEFTKNFSYISGNFDKLEDFEKLKERIIEIEKNCKTKSNKLFYFSTHPNLFAQIFKNLSAVNLNVVNKEQKGGWSRVLIEKPFGHNLESSKDLEKTISKCFNDDQIFRIDHYLFKQSVENIKTTRLQNDDFNSLLNNKNLRAVEIILHETMGVEDRGAFYEKVGALRDVGQNHLISILALLSMEINESMSCVEAQKSRTKAIKSLKQWTENELIENTKRSQYESYQAVNGVEKDSQTETFFSIKTELDNENWRGIPIILEAGKKMPEIRKEIVLTFKENENLKNIVPKIANKSIIQDENKIIFKLENEVQYIEEYSKIIESGMRGDREFFLTKEEIEAAWTFVDPIIETWEQNNVKLLKY